MAKALLFAGFDTARSTPPESLSPPRNIWMSPVLWKDIDATTVYINAFPTRFLIGSGAPESPAYTTEAAPASRAIRARLCT